MSVPFDPPAVEPTLDRSVLESYRELQDEGEPDIVTEFIDTFLGDLPARLAAIEVAVGSSEPTAIRAAAHALKGSCSTIGALRLQTLCAELEHLGKSGAGGNAAPIRAAIDAEAVSTRRALEQLRAP